MRELNGAWFDMTRHAVQRALDMALTDEQIRETLGNPRFVTSGKAGREMWTREKITAVMEPHDGYWSVVTFLWATPDAWVRDRETIQSRTHEATTESNRRFRYANKMRKKGRGR